MFIVPSRLICMFQLFNRYRAFRRAWDMRCLLYVVCYGMCILSKFDAILGVLWEDFGATWVYLGAILGCWGYLGAILGGLGGYLGSLWGLGFRV